MTRLLLIGGGHAHLQVLEAIARQPFAGWQVRLVSPFPRLVYSGMLPGWVAGHYAIDDCSIAIDRLAARAGVEVIRDALVDLDLERREVRCADGSAWPFDLLSIDTGARAAVDALPGAFEHGLPLRPIEGFVAAWPSLLRRLRNSGPRLDIAVLGAGAAGVELAFALRHRATVERCPPPRITLIGFGALPLDARQPASVRRRIAQLLTRRGIAWLGERQAIRLDADRIVFESGASQRFDACLVATGVAAPEWTQRSALALDPAGFIRVDACLRSVSHPAVFAAGDVAALTDPRPQSGVFAVRAGGALAINLRAACAGQPLLPWTPQRRALYLVSTGALHAIALWGRWSIAGGWVWRWKDAIDRRFVRRFRSAD